MGEAGLWIEDTPRTDEAEIAASVRAGEMLVATADGRMVGCARVRALDETTAEVGLISVDPRSWGGGAGRALIDAAEDRARSRGAATMKLNLLVPRDGVHPNKQRLHAWYTRRGYTVYDRVPFETSSPTRRPTSPSPATSSSSASPSAKGVRPLTRRRE